MTALKNCSAELRNYLFDYKLPEVFEALLTGLAIECPSDACEFVVDKLSLLNSNPDALESLQWDSFVSAENMPKDHLLRREVLWCYEDENSQPTPEMYLRAYSLYNYKLKLMCLQGWIKFHAMKKEKKKNLLIGLNNARSYHKRRKLRVFFMAYY
ncbi:Hypothetical predicted protein, partial [Paramuricea clavata]